MGKKSKMIKNVEKCFTFTSSGKIKLKKDQKFDLKKFIEKTLSNHIVSRLNGIISEEEIKIENEDMNLKVDSNLISEYETVAYFESHKEPPTTVIYSMPKKKACEFDMLDDGSLGKFLRTSTFVPVYNEIKKEWLSLNKDDKTEFVNILYLPDIIVFADNSGKILSSPYKVNLMFVCFPNINKMADKGVILNDYEIKKIIVENTLEAAIKCGCKRLVTYPFNHKELKKNIYESSEVWKNLLSTKRVRDNIDTINFPFACDEDEYIIFNASLKK